MTAQLQWDLFISHASEDKWYARRLADLLIEMGVSVWLDEKVLRVGQSLRRAIDEGLSNSRYGVVILSEHFFQKEWPQKELAALFAREDVGNYLILPIWHSVSATNIKKFSPMLADKVALTTSEPLDVIARKIAEVVAPQVFENLMWTSCELKWADDTKMVILPLRPDGSGHTAVAIGKFPVTNSQYKRFIEADDPRARDSSPPRGQHLAHDGNQEYWKDGFCPWEHEGFQHPNNPVVCISYEDALRYAAWVNDCAKKGRGFLDEPITCLPTARLWDFAAYGTPHAKREPGTWLSQIGSVHHKASHPMPASDERANARGIIDMIGNIWEWCLGNNSFLLTRLGGIDVAFEKNAELRGGGYLDDLDKIEPHMLSAVLKDGANTRHSDLGFRIAAQLPISMLPDDARKQLMLCEESARAYLIQRDPGDDSNAHATFGRGWGFPGAYNHW